MLLKFHQISLFSRISHLEMFLKRCFQKFRKVEKQTSVQVLSVEFCEIFENIFSWNISSGCFCDLTNILTGKFKIFVSTLYQYQMCIQNPVKHLKL